MSEMPEFAQLVHQEGAPGRSAAEDAHDGHVIFPNEDVLVAYLGQQGSHCEAYCAELLPGDVRLGFVAWLQMRPHCTIQRHQTEVPRQL